MCIFRNVEVLGLIILRWVSLAMVENLMVYLDFTTSDLFGAKAVCPLPALSRKRRALAGRINLHVKITKADFISLRLSATTHYRVLFMISCIYPKYNSIKPWFSKAIDTRDVWGKTCLEKVENMIGGQFWGYSIHLN